MKKRIFTLLVAVVAMLIGMSVSANSYKIWVAGVQVTDENKDSIPNTAIEKGMVWYDSESNELWLEDAMIKCDEGIRIGMNLTVRSVKETVIDADRTAFAIEGGANVTFRDCRLNLSSQRSPGLYLFESGMKAINTYIKSKGRWGIAGNYGDVEKIDLEYCYLELEGTEAACSDILSMSITGAAILDGVTFDSSLKALASGGAAVKKAVIEDVCRLVVLGKNTTLSSHSFAFINGWFDYDNTTNTLTFTDMQDMNKPSETLIVHKIPGLTVKTNGYCQNITCKNGVYARAATTFENCKLEVNVSRLGIYMDNVPVVIKNSKITIKSDEWALAGEARETEKLDIIASELVLNGKTAAIGDVGGLNLTRCEIISPAGAAFNPETFAVEQGGKVVTNLEINYNKYDLHICGTQVTDQNCIDIRPLGLHSGTIRYVPSDKTLIFDGVNLTSQSGAMIKNYIAGLCIKAVNDNSLKTLNQSSGNSEWLIQSNDDCIIEGQDNSKLAITGNFCGLYINGNLEIRDVTLDIYGKWLGIQGGSDETVTIKNSNVKITGEKHPVWYIGALNLEGCAITAPENAVFDAAKKCVVANGVEVKGTVEIQKGAGVEGVIAEDAEDLNAPMFNVMGQQIAQPYNGQIYIRNGRKKVWRE